MPSAALIALKAALNEISDLRRAGRLNRSPTPAKLRVARAVGRAQVVLLCSHFEHYFYAVNEEAVVFLNGRAIPANALSENLRLLHSKPPIDEMADTAWENRANKLRDLVASDGWLWIAALRGTLDHKRLLAWMKAPKPESLVRYFRYWQVPDVFSAITRTVHTRNLLRLGVQELVDQRNKIAHGDFSAQATPSDIERYSQSVRKFCERADALFARTLRGITAGHPPW